AGGPFHLIAPKVIEIRLHGKLRNWVSAKDVILTVLERYGVKGNVNCIFEYTGEGVASLEVPERSTICNMGAECGVTTSLFPSDEKTRLFLKAQGREADWTELAADADATYDGLFEIDLSTLEPKMACPHSPGNIAPVSSLAGKSVDQVLIGSCTNSSYADMKKVADILDGHTVAPNVSLGIAPGSREVLLMLSQDGSLGKLIQSGARILESACGFCIGNHQSPGTEGVSLRTSNRNFEGRSGTKTGQVYLVSPETAALAAITGRFTDPLSDHGISYPKVVHPTLFLIDDTMFVFPPEDGAEVQIFRGPNIGDPPKNTPLKESLEGYVTIKVGDKITTDHIMPAGARLKYRSNIPVYSKYVFEPVDEHFSERCTENQDRGKDNFIVAGSSYGQGSSREHAAICPMYLGVKAVIALSIERIHQNNLCNFGIIPLTFVDEADYQKLDQNDELVLENVKQQIEGKEVVLKNKTKSLEIRLLCDITDEQRSMLIGGGLLNILKERN
ncbi:MAG: aconitate hydratase, partial [Spirochaetia bacterium]|nr:aconitate hydratase [Spirochaetia bacterium]